MSVTQSGTIESYGREDRRAPPRSHPSLLSPLYSLIAERSRSITRGQHSLWDVLEPADAKLEKRPLFQEHRIMAVEGLDPLDSPGPSTTKGQMLNTYCLVNKY